VSPHVPYNRRFALLRVAIGASVTGVLTVGSATETDAQRPTRQQAPVIRVATPGPAPTNFQFTELQWNKVQVAWDAVPGATLYRIRRRRSERDPNPLVTAVVEPKFIDNTAGLPPYFTIIYEVTTENPTHGAGAATAAFRTRDVHPSGFQASVNAKKVVHFNWTYPALSGPIKHFLLAGANGAPTFIVPNTRSYWDASGLPSGTYTYTLLMYFDAPGGIHESNLETAPRVTVVVP
jgi:hypothetical protein